MKTMSANTMSRTEKNDSNEGSIVASLKHHGVFQDGSETMKNMTTDDVVTPVIQESLFGAEYL